MQHIQANYLLTDSYCKKLESTESSHSHAATPTNTAAARVVPDSWRSEIAAPVWTAAEAEELPEAPGLVLEAPEPVAWGPEVVTAVANPEPVAAAPPEVLVELEAPEMSVERCEPNVQLGYQEQVV
jgi:hypothetical protein